MARRRAWRSGRAPVIGVVALATLAAPGTAEPALTGFLSQRVEAGEGLGGDGFAVRSLTEIGATIEARTPTSSVRLSPGVAVAVTSRGDEDSPARFRFSAAASHRAPRTALTASASVTPDFVDDTQFEDTGVTERSTLQITSTLRLGLTRDLDPVTQASTGFTASLRDFDGETEQLAATRSFGVDGGLSRRVNPTDTVSVSGGLRLFRSEADGDPESVSANFRFGLQRQVTARTGFGASLGPSITQTTRSDRSDEIGFGLVGALNLSHDVRGSRVSVGLTQDVDQNSLGEVENQSRLRAGVTHRLTERSRLSFDVSAGFQNPLFDGGDDRRTLSISPSYAVDVTENWGVNLGVRLRVSDDDGEVEMTNLVFFRVSRDLSILP